MGDNATATFIAEANMYGVSVDELQILNQKSIHQDAAQLEKILAEDHEVITLGVSRHSIQHFTSVSGSEHMLEVVKVPFEDPGNQQRHVLSVATDVTELRQAEQKLTKIVRALHAIGEVNNLLMHADNEDQLLHDVCRVMVDVVDYRMAWIGYKQDDEKQSIRLMAQVGHDRVI